MVGRRMWLRCKEHNAACLIYTRWHNCNASRVACRHVFETRFAASIVVRKMCKKPSILKLEASRGWS